MTSRMEGARRVTVLIAAVVGLLLVASPGGAQMGKGRVQGKVTDTDGNPLEGVKVTAHNPDVTPSTLTATTDDEGNWAVIGVTSDTWSFTFEKPGYGTVEVEQTVRGLGPNPDLDVVLERAGPGSGRGVRPAAESGTAADDSRIDVAMQELLNEGVTRNDVALDHALYFFPARENNTYTVVAFEVGKDGLSLEDGTAAVTLFGALIERGEDGEEHVLRERMRMPFEVAADEGTASDSQTRSFGTTLAPGTYRLTWGVIDDESGAISTLDTTFEVPNLSSKGLSLTSVLLSRGQFGENTEPIDINTVYEGVRVGTVSADADIDHTFEPNGTLMLLYFVLGAQVDSSDQQISVEVEHLVVDSEGNGLARLPVQELDYFAIGQQIPLSRIDGLEPGGDYAVRIQVKDIVSGQQVTEEVPFHIVGEEGEQEGRVPVERDFRRRR